MAAMMELAAKEREANPIGAAASGKPEQGLRGKFAAERRGVGATPGIDNREEVAGLPQRAKVKNYGRMIQ